jgi:hypothetical protein
LKGQPVSNVVYADGIGAITMIGGIARIELVCLAAVDKDKVSAKPTGTLAIPLAGLVRAHQDLTKLMDKLVADGVLNRREPAPPVGPADVRSEPAN